MAFTPRMDLRRGVTEPVILMISRPQVLAGDTASVLTSLRPFLATPEDAWLYRSHMSLVVDGYNDDPRELVDSPQVRDFLKTLDQQWGPTGLFSSTKWMTASNCWGLVSAAQTSGVRLKSMAGNSLISCNGASLA